MSKQFNSRSINQQRRFGHTEKLNKTTNSSFRLQQEGTHCRMSSLIPEVLTLSSSSTTNPYAHNHRQKDHKNQTYNQAQAKIQTTNQPPKARLDVLTTQDKYKNHTKEKARPVTAGSCRHLQRKLPMALNGWVGRPIVEPLVLIIELPAMDWGHMIVLHRDHLCPHPARLLSQLFPNPPVVTGSDKERVHCMSQ